MRIALKCRLLALAALPLILAMLTSKIAYRQRQLKLYGYGISTLLLSADGRRIVTGSYREQDGYRVETWDAQAHAQLPSLFLPWTGDPRSGAWSLVPLAISDDGKYLACQDPDRFLLIFNVDTRQIIRPRRSDSIRQATSFLRGTHKLLDVGCFAWQIDCDTGKQFQRKKPKGFPFPYAWAIAAPDGEHFLNLEDGLRLFDFATRHPPSEKVLASSRGRTSYNILDFGFSPSGKLAFAIGEIVPYGSAGPLPAFCDFLDGVTGKVIRQTGIASGKVTREIGVAFGNENAIMPGEKEFAVLRQGRIDFYSVLNGKPTQSLRAPDDLIKFVASPDGRFLIGVNLKRQLTWIPCAQ